jgi:hypothetical protein
MYILLSPHNTCLVGEPVPLFKLEAHPPYQRDAKYVGQTANIAAYKYIIP